uniref:Uncharacterized protein n=1 Tax=Anguilla anguilla TaxID=7936 RepID=A0A0E9RM01_ANGAN
MLLWPQSAPTLITQLSCVPGMVVALNDCIKCLCQRPTLSLTNVPLDGTCHSVRCYEITLWRCFTFNFKSA